MIVGDGGKAHLVPYRKYIHVRTYRVRLSLEIGNKIKIS